MNNSALDVVVPVYNEEDVLEKNVLTVYKFLEKSVSIPWQIVIADNASTDRTLDIAKNLSKRYERIRYIHLDEKGRGRALKRAWSESSADIMCYTDVDLAYDLEALPRLIQEIQKGHSIATGNRYDNRSKMDRGLKRTILSYGYKTLARWILKTQLHDFQGGIKAITKSVRAEVLPKVQDTKWFFDTELLVLAEKMGHPIVQIPVSCRQGKQTKVAIWSTVNDFLRNLFKLRSRLKAERLL